MTSIFDPEKIFMQSKTHSLDASDKATIKYNLLEHATRSLVQFEQPTPSMWSSWLIRGSTAFASLVFLFGGTTYAAHDSQPGEMLYAVKVHVNEEIIRLAKYTPEARVGYDITRLESRLTELHALAETGNETALTALTEYISAHTDDALTALNMSSSGDIPYPQQLTYLVRISSILAAQDMQAEKLSLEGAPNHALHVTQDKVDEILSQKVNDFISYEAETGVAVYLQTVLDSVSTELNASSTPPSVVNAAGQYVYDVGEALNDGNLDAAMMAITQAEETIITSTYEASTSSQREPELQSEQ